MDPVIARYGTTPDLLTQIWDQSLVWGPIDAGVARGLQLAWLHPDGTIQTDIAIVLAGLYTCVLDPATPDNTGDGSGGALAGTLTAVPGDILTVLEGSPRPGPSPA